MLMVVEREMRATARRPGTYWVRAAAGAFAGLALLQNTSDGRRIFFTAVAFAFVACLLDGVRRGAGAVNDEKNEGTFGLLALSPLTGPQILYGKFFAMALLSFQTAIAAVPALGACLLLGGVSAGEFFRASVALANTLSVSLALSLILSAHVKDASRVMMRSVLFLLGGMMFFTAFATSDPFLFRVLSPMTLPDMRYHGGAAAFWGSIIVTQFAVYCALWLTGDNLIANWKKEEAETKGAWRLEMASLLAQAQVTPLFPTRRAPRWFTMNPMQWLTLREINQHRRHPVLVPATALVALVSPFIGGFGFLTIVAASAALVGWLCVAAAKPIAIARHNGALELLVTTPLSERDIVAGHFAALRQAFFWSLAIVALGVLGTLWKASLSEASAVFTFLYIWLGFVFVCLATPWIGMVLALKCKTVSRAISWTVFVVMLIPRIVTCVFGDAVIFPIAGLWCRSWIYKNFRRAAADRYSAG